ncbi:FKBP-type peptidyl-prolyl cis-trans isomerase [Sphingomonas prati]|nr:FKBP-type peptidyl-prolyl cis-trans isomerase [Sphingomonas prati]
MKSSSIPFCRLVLTSVLPLLPAPLPASAAPARGATTSAVAPPATGPGNGIIALPPNPVVPAALRTCAARTPTGLGYTILRPATGSRPASTDIALVSYIGYLAATGAVFDQGMNSPLPVDGVIPGFAEALQMLAKTGVARFCVPPALGYGAQGSGQLPANADLVFQVELLDYKTAAEVEKMRSTQAPEPAGQ